MRSSSWVVRDFSLASSPISWRILPIVFFTLMTLDFIYHLACKVPSRASPIILIDTKLLVTRVYKPENFGWTSFDFLSDEQTDMPLRINQGENWFYRTISSVLALTIFLLFLPATIKFKLWHCAGIPQQKLYCNKILNNCGLVPKVESLKSFEIH